MSITADDIRDRMDELGLTQRELADRAGMSPGSLSSILAGHRPIGMTTAERLAAALRCTIELVPLEEH